MTGLLQRQVAERLGVNTWTYLLWEQDKHLPAIGHYPAIFAFLGYDPFPAPTTLPERIASHRRKLGLPAKEAARRLGVDEGTFLRWESGEWKPRKSGSVVEAFLALT
jgi:DNA-binding transcriptional regulator YiaG